MRKTIIIGTVVVIAIAAGALFFVLRGGSSPAGGGGTTGTLPPVATGTAPFTPPTGATLTIGTPEGGVVMNNFYNTTRQVSADHTAILIEQTSTYNITYYAPDSSFNILIEAAPFETVRAEAEQAFLQALGISQADACKLNVKVGTTIDVDPDYAGVNLGLSFCAAGAFQPQ
ncbi:MAG TPA: hypothetical protein VMT81_01040 [Candidatus Paceibacterota bacterium]|nr:hypothetical protein [Candidatus Paceibacterota bacterium]